MSITAPARHSRGTGPARWSLRPDTSLPVVLDPRGEVPLVHIVSGSYGAGHDAAARQLAARFRHRGYRVEMFDVVDMFPAGLGRAIRAAYFRQLRALPGSWDWLLHRLEDEGVLRRTVTAALAAAVGVHLGRAVSDAGDDPVLVVSTHPFASLALGHLRASGQLDVPVATYLTDMSVHPLWVHSGVDLHLAVHELPAAEARRRGALRTAVVGPLTPPVVAQPMSGALHVDAARERARLGLPDGVPLALVTGGSKGVGDLAATARDIVAGGLATPVVLCGENDILRARLQGSGEVVALGWRDDVPELMSAVDCVVQNAGGFTSLEALAAGVPTLSYRCIPGHGQTNAQALHEAGWVPWAHTPEDLERVLGQMLGRGHHGAHPAWDNRTSLDVVAVLESQMSGRPALQIPA